MRLIGYNTGEADHVSRAGELHVFKPGRDGGRLLTIVDHIVHDFVVRDAATDRQAWRWAAANQAYEHCAR